MASSSLSLSQSLSSSLILYQHQYERRRKAQQRLQRRHGQNQEGSYYENYDKNTTSDSETPETYAEISVFKQLVLTAVSFGYNCSVEFAGLYSVVSMQYFGLPVYLVSLPGIISGGLNSFVVPLLGRYSDRGPNPLKRKLTLLSLTSVCLLTGYTVLGICSYLKLVQMNERWGYSNSSRLISTDYNIHTDNTFEPRTISSSSNHSVSILNNEQGKTGSDSGSDSKIPIVAIFSVLPFVLFDTGYDTSIAMSRASVLEIVPVQQRNNILTMAGLMSGFAGILAAVIGIIDFPGIFGSAFEIDGFALTLILFSVVYGILGLATSVCSVRGIWKSHCENSKLCKVNQFKDGVLSLGKTSSRIKPSSLSLSIDNAQNGRLLNDKEKQAVSTTTTTHYGAFISSSGNPALSESMDILDSGQSHVSITESLQNGDESETETPDTESRNFSTNPNELRYHLSKKPSTTSLLQSISQSYEKVLGECYLQKLKEEKEKKQIHQHNTSEPKSQSLLCNMRFIVCILAIFFCSCAATSITYYQSNTLTFEVYGGDPMALPGSPGRILYQKAIRMSSFGTLSAYISFLAFLVTSPKLIARLGALNVFIVTNSLEAIAGSLFCVYPGLETYFAMMVSYGINKAVVLAVTYIIAMLYTPLDVVEMPVNNGGSGSHQDVSSSATSSKVIGQVIALVAATMPLCYVVTSAIMGPLMDATGSAWPPMYFSIVSAFGAAITGIILSLLK